MCPIRRRFLRIVRRESPGCRMYVAALRRRHRGCAWSHGAKTKLSKQAIDARKCPVQSPVMTDTSEPRNGHARLCGVDLPWMDIECAADAGVVRLAERALNHGVR